MIKLDPGYWAAKSWVDSANDPAVGFPLQSLPYCAFLSSSNSEDAPHLGVGIGTFVLDLHALSQSRWAAVQPPEILQACAAPKLNQLMRSGPHVWSSMRQWLTTLLKEDATPDRRQAIQPMLIPMSSVHFVKPASIANYTDFYASIDHATNVGRLFRPDQPLLPNYRWIPIGYHGRASSLIVSGANIRRPYGQIKAPNRDAPDFAPTRQLDFELEVAAYVGTGNALGTPVSIDSAENHIFGLTLLNDWSARDIQSWEYQPLGPFLGKSFATSISPWVIPSAALQPFRVPLRPRSSEYPKPLPYLDSPSLESEGGIDLTLEVFLSTSHMRQAQASPTRLSIGNLRNLYWTFAQMLAHHTSNGCNLLEGDLLASGTVSGPQEGAQGCLLELTRRGQMPVRLPNGESRTFLEDGDEIILRGSCQRDGFPRIGFGECRGTIQPAANPG